MGTLPTRRRLLLAAPLLAGAAAAWRAAGILATEAKELDLATATIADLQAAMAAGALTAERLVEQYLARIEAYDRNGPKLNSLIAVNPTALAVARELDRERAASGPRSLLHGMPIVVKDLVNTAGLQTTGGFIAMKGAVPARDAHIIAKLRAAGAIVLAKTNMSDWLGRSHPDGGSSIAGQVVNPYDLKRTVAPSSSGVGASMAAWFAAGGIGSETGTSIRNPTTDGALVGLAPTEGLIGRSGAMANTFTHERLGPMARSTFDVAALLDNLIGVDGDDLVTAQSLPHLPNASYTTFLDPDGLRGARIGILREMFRDGPKHADGLALAERAILDLHAAGAIVLDPVVVGIDLKRTRMLKVNYWEAETVLDAYFRHFGAGSPFTSVRDMVAKEPQRVKPAFAEYFDYSPGPDPEYRARLRGRRALREAIVGLLDEHALDAVAFPYNTLPDELLDGRERDLDPINATVRAGDRVTESDNYLSSMTGLPGLLVPMGYTSEGVPLSLELLGRPFSEPTLLKLASGFEARTHHRRAPTTTPPLPGEAIAY